LLALLRTAVNLTTVAAKRHYATHGEHARQLERKRKSAVVRPQRVLVA